jgi:hypothetical protein
MCCNNYNYRFAYSFVRYQFFFIGLLFRVEKELTFSLCLYVSVEPDKACFRSTRLAILLQSSFSPHLVDSTQGGMRKTYQICLENLNLRNSIRDLTEYLLLGNF